MEEEAEEVDKEEGVERGWLGGVWEVVGMAWLGWV